jgi:hypothetical protein
VAAVNPDQIVYLFDHGQPWCEGRHLHPQHRPDGYPGIDHHPTECQSYGGWFEGWFEDARAGLNGPPGFLNCYLARPFRYGQKRFVQDDEDRLAIEFLPRDDGAGEPFRCSIPASTIRNLAAHLNHTADVGDGWREPQGLTGRRAIARLPVRLGTVGFVKPPIAELSTDPMLASSWREGRP